MPGYILGEVVLSFLGVGVQEPARLVGQHAEPGAQPARADVVPVAAAAPGTAIFLTVMAFNFLGDGLRDALDPRRRAGKAGR